MRISDWSSDVCSSDLLTINPLLILVSLSFWGWVWGTPGALLAVPLLLILQTILHSTGPPDLAGFLFERGTLTAAEDMRRQLHRAQRKSNVLHQRAGAILAGIPSTRWCTPRVMKANEGNEH